MSMYHNLNVYLLLFPFYSWKLTHGPKTYSYNYKSLNLLRLLILATKVSISIYIDTTCAILFIKISKKQCLSSPNALLKN